MNDHADSCNRNTRNNMKGGEHWTSSQAMAREMTYHYAGKVHVRGLLRRVWRPRYLALGDDGYLRYHESLPPLYQQDPPRLSPAHAILYNIHHTHRPKTILAILDGARTIDPHSVADQHVALPQGVYGFVFRGRPVELYATESPNIKESVSDTKESWDPRNVVPRELGAVALRPGDAKILVHQDRENRAHAIASKQSAKAAVVDLVFPKGTSRRRTAQIIAKKAINPDVLCGFVRNNCDGDISRTSSSSSLMGYEQPFLEECGQDANGTELDSNHEWGGDSHESHETIGSFQQVDGVQVYTVNDGSSSFKPGQKDKAQVLTSKSKIQVQVQASTIQSREYLCAVTTAEEAESKRVSHTTSEEDNVIEFNTLIASDGNSKASIPSHGWCKAEACHSLNECNNELVSDVANRSAETATSFRRKSPPTPGGATIVVTKVSRIQLPENALFTWVSKKKINDTVPWLPFYLPLPGEDLVLHYEIKLLLLRHCRPRDETIQPEKAEERTINKSIVDVLALVRDLMTEFVAAKRGTLIGEGEGGTRSKSQDGTKEILLPHNTFLLLEDIESELLSCVESFAKFQGPYQSRKSKLLMPSDAIAEVSYTMTVAMNSVRTIDSVMRKLSKDRNVCSSYHFQRFLCLQSSLHPATSNAISSQIIFSKETDAESLVRKWLSKTTKRPSTRTNIELALAVAMRHGFCGAIISSMVVWSTVRIASLIWCMISGTGIVVTVSFETYATLVIFSFFLGHNNGVSSRFKHDKYDLYNHKRQCDNDLMLSPPSADSKEAERSGDFMSMADDDHSTLAEEGDSESDNDMFIAEPSLLASPLPLFPSNHGISCWSRPDHNIFLVRGRTYLVDRIKVPSAPAVFQCRGVDVWITDNAERHISRHPSVLGGNLDREDTFVVNFLLPFGNFVAYFTVPPLEEMPANIVNVWTKFIKGDQQYRDGKLKLLPVVVDGPWIVKKAVGPGTSPAMIGRDLPLQYYFTEPSGNQKRVYEVDILVTASRIARGILNVVKGHAKSLTIALALIIEASEEAELPETVLSAFQVHSLHLEDCPNLPDCYPDG
ncbi:hypothetical protein ACHAXA_005721 [Cyclostephanos tholiformis]|uniref:Protein ENHANCED DISEASE RESISTANCE 2 C-terminal domain-containing protein n=1 Tax=Cyclostephanos tholiformis TaxID=382380 RepID=A0ABD3RMC8_9STRA